MSKKLTRNLNDKMIAGVAAGLAEYFQLDVTWVRVAFVLAAFFGGGGLWIYIILWIAVPEQTYASVFENSSTPNNDTMFNDPILKKSKEKINGSLIGGLVMIALGSYFLLDEFDIIPDWFNVSKLWPLIFVFIGLSILFKGAKQEAAAKKFDTSDFNTSTTDAQVKTEEEVKPQHEVKILPTPNDETL
jgi:phage shock protein C